MNMRAEADSTIGDPIFVRAAKAEIAIGRAPCRLSGRERELAVAIAVQRQPVSAIALGHLLYPDRDDADASNVVKVYVYRLRKRVAGDFIVWDNGGYALGRRVQVDVAEARRFLERLSPAGAIRPDEREIMLELARGLRSESDAAPLPYGEWFETLARRLHRLGHDLAIHAGLNALEVGHVREAIGIGRELTYEDPCDEEAWELLIRAQLHVGEHLAAVQGFRYYEAILAKELDAAPSGAIRRLFEDYARP
jgi:DNA-binding SARP family transcriptional activator